MVTDGFNSLAIRGTQYDNNGTFFGGCISCTKEVFMQVNGYSNLYCRGWGGEDTNLYLRALKEKILNYSPDEGFVIDIEEEKATTNDDREMEMKYGLYPEDGLSNLIYDIEYENISNNFYHIIIDPKHAEHEKLFPQHFDTSHYSNEKYKEHRTKVSTMKFVINKMSNYGSKNKL